MLKRGDTLSFTLSFFFSDILLYSSVSKIEYFPKENQTLKISLKKKGKEKWKEVQILSEISENKGIHSKQNCNDKSIKKFAKNLSKISPHKQS